jgi:predicted DNA-binding protein (UPF0251 family)
MAVLHLVLIEEYPLQEAAKELGIKVEALKKRLFRAKKRARALAEDLGLPFTAAASDSLPATKHCDNSDIVTPLPARSY